jgi:hypothetical protein
MHIKSQLRIGKENYVSDRGEPLPLEPIPGTYRVRLVKDGPWVPVRIAIEQGLWVCLIAGRVMPDSGKADPFEVSWLLHHWPMHRISEIEYLALSCQHADAQEGHPLAEPNQPVNLRNSRSLW